MIPDFLIPVVYWGVAMNLCEGGWRFFTTVVRGVIR